MVFAPPAVGRQAVGCPQHNALNNAKIVQAVDLAALGSVGLSFFHCHGGLLNQL